MKKINWNSAIIVFLNILTVLVEIAGAVGIAAILFAAYPKRYPVLWLQGEGLIGGLVLLMWIAAAVVAVVLEVILIKKILTRSAALILSVCMVLAAVLVNIFVLFVLLLMPPVASETTDVADYLAVDELVEQQEEHYSLIFPEEIPEQAQDVEYSYTAYETFFTLDYAISACWTLPEEEYLSMKEKILADTVSFRRAYGSGDQSETVEGKERFVIAEMDPNRYVPLPEMMVDFDDAACRISCRAHMEREF